MVRADCGRVGERLVIIRNYLLKGARGVLRSEPLLVMVGLKAPHCGPRKFDFAETCLFKSNRKRLRRPVFFAHEGNH